PVDQQGLFAVEDALHPRARLALLIRLRLVWLDLEHPLELDQRLRLHVVQLGSDPHGEVEHSIVRHLARSPTGRATSSNFRRNALRIFSVTASDVARPEKNRLAVVRLMPTAAARLSMLSRCPSTCRYTRARLHLARSRVYGIPR